MMYVKFLAKLSIFIYISKLFVDFLKTFLGCRLYGCWVIAGIEAIADIAGIEAIAVIAGIEVIAVIAVIEVIVI